MFNSYDLALTKYHKSAKITHLPLISWEFFSFFNLEFSNFNNLQKNWKNKISYKNKIANNSVIITDKNLTILFATKTISLLTGYNVNEIVGNTPKMFQGEKSDTQSKLRISEAIKNKQPFKEIITNYKKDGSTYKCEIKAFPMFDKYNNLVNYIAFEKIAS